MMNDPTLFWLVIIGAGLFMVFFLWLSWKLLDRLLNPVFDTTATMLQDAESDYQRWVTITGAETCDEIEDRIRQIKRALNPEVGGTIKVLLLSPNRRTALEEALAILERTYVRNCADPTPPSTIIGYQQW